MVIKLTEEQKEAIKNILVFVKDYISETEEPLLPELDGIFND